MLFGKKEQGKESGSPQSSAHIHYKEELANMREQITRIQTRADMLEAKEAAQKELREITNKKFDSIQGQIGEIREMFKILSSEKKELEVKISQTLEIVKQVQPTEVAKKISAISHQISVIEGKNQLLHKQYDKFKNDFDAFSHKLKVFKGEDELLKLQLRVKGDLDDVNKISHQASMHASKIENHFIKINEKATSIQTAISEQKALYESLLKLQSDLTKQSEELKEVPHEDVVAKVNELEETVGGLADLTTETFAALKKDITAHHEKATSAVNPVEFEKMKRWVTYLIKELEKSKNKTK